MDTAMIWIISNFLFHLLPFIVAERAVAKRKIGAVITVVENIVMLSGKCPQQYAVISAGESSLAETVKDPNDNHIFSWHQKIRFDAVDSLMNPESFGVFIS